MTQQDPVSRRDFIKVMGLMISTLTLKACLPKIPTPEATALPPTETATPTEEVAQQTIPGMILVKAGSFEMGSTGGRADEQPVHPVTISKDFHIGKNEVTFDEYDTFCETTARYNKPDDRGTGRGKHPVVGVTWQEAIDYCNWRSEAEGLTPCYSGKGKVTVCDFAANGYRLPTEAEWEYAARGAQESNSYRFAGSNDPQAVAWYVDNANETFHPVGEKEPNELGIYDMSGNSFEWCWDWYLKDYYARSPETDPSASDLPKVDSPWDLVRVRRSGSWSETVEHIRITARSFDSPSYAGSNGFRLVRNA